MQGNLNLEIRWRQSISTKKRDQAFRSRAINIAAVHRHFAGLEALAREARSSRDPRVLNVALGVLALQPANVRELLIQV